MAPQPLTAAPLALPLPAEGPCSLAWWQDQITAAKKKRDDIAKDAGWKDRISSYLGKSLSDTPKADTIVVPKDYANVEQKKAQLFTQIPEIYVEPKRDEFADAAPIVQAVIRDYLGPHHINAEAVMNEVIFDALCPAGIMCSKIGYESVQDGTVAVPTGELDPLGQPVTVQAPKTIWEDYFWERISPLKMLIPADFHGSDYDKSPWLGFEFDFDPTDDTGLNPTETLTLESNARTQGSKQSGVEIWYKASTCDPTEKHPQKYRRLLFKNEAAVAHEPSPYQKVLNDGTLIGMRRNPVRIGALRYVSDSAYPPSDCAMSQPQVEELSKGRTQMIQQRDKNVPMRWANISGLAGYLTQPDIEKITKGTWQGIIPLNGPGQDLIGEVARAQFPRENFEFDKIINRDLSETWALSVTPGSEVDGPKTATEASLFQGRTDMRLRKERQSVLAYFVAAAQELFSLIQLFADDADYVRVVGADGVSKLKSWDKTTVAGEYAFTAKPDSAVFQDQAAQRKRAEGVFQFLAPNHYINQQELAAWFLRQHDMEPAKFIAPPKAPEPNKPNVSFSFKGEDLNPMSPQAPIVAEIMVQAGFTISPGAISKSMEIAQMLPPQPARPAPGGGIDHAHVQTGTAPTQGPLNKHSADESGMLNSGLAPGVQ